MRILLLSAYDTDSHRAWCQGLMAHLPEYEWHYLKLPGRYFSWRIRGNALSFAYGEDAHILNQPFDLIVATSMVDLATLKGLCQNLAHTPSLLYFHENQFAYPKSAQQHASIEPQMVNLFSALSADRILFNSEFNQKSFVQGVTDLFNRLPDHAPKNAITRIAQKSSVMSVPIQIPANDTSNESPVEFKAGDPLNVIWNHRWEYDKGPDTLYTCIELCAHKQLNVRFTICGMSFRNTPKAFAKLASTSFDNVSHMGTFKDRSEYLNQLAKHHVVLSTAIHEFQGLALLEGAAHGCVPLAPDRLAYPEWIGKDYLYQSDPVNEAHAICEKLEVWQEKGLPPKIDVCHYDWQHLKLSYKKVFNQTVTKQSK